MDVQSLHAEHHPQIFKMPHSNDFAVSSFDTMLADPMVTIFIAEEDEQSLGCIVCKLVEREETPFAYGARFLYIDQISVQPAAQGRGIGTALLEQAQALAKELNVQRIQLDSWTFNLGAHKFFERNGFEKSIYRFWRHS
jgi:ribosomal protein S18 acetylase RimI-like enzyme